MTQEEMQICRYLSILNYTRQVNISSDIYVKKQSFIAYVNTNNVSTPKDIEGIVFLIH